MAQGDRGVVDTGFDRNSAGLCYVRDKGSSLHISTSGSSDDERVLSHAILANNRVQLEPFDLDSPKCGSAGDAVARSQSIGVYGRDCLGTSIVPADSCYEFVRSQWLCFLKGSYQGTDNQTSHSHYKYCSSGMGISANLTTKNETDLASCYTTSSSSKSSSAWMC